jgi:hypothetical protein
MSSEERVPQVVSLEFPSDLLLKVADSAEREELTVNEMCIRLIEYGCYMDDILNPTPDPDYECQTYECQT